MQFIKKIYQIKLRIFQNIHYFRLFLLQNDCFSFHHTRTAAQFLFLQNSWVVHSYSLLSKFIMGDILADTAIFANASKKEPLCSCYERTSRACLQLNGMAAQKKGFVCQENLSTCNYRKVLGFRLFLSLRCVFDNKLTPFIPGNGFACNIINSYFLLREGCQ